MHRPQDIRIGDRSIAIDVKIHGSLITRNDCEVGKKGSYGDIVGAVAPYFNSGAICMDVIQHWAVAGLWSVASKYCKYSPGQGAPLGLACHGDQGVLNSIVVLLNKVQSPHLFDQAEWCDSGQVSIPVIKGIEGDRLSVINARTGKTQRLVHSTGPKWWTDEGKRHLAAYGDKLRCFEHFFSLKPA